MSGVQSGATEAGLTVPAEAFARACDTAFPQMGGWFARFYQDSRGWSEAFPPAFREFATCEAEAVALRWFEHSLIPGTNGGGCVEAGAGAAPTPDRVILVRDTTNRAGAVLAIPADAWRRFTDELR